MSLFVLDYPVYSISLLFLVFILPVWKKSRRSKLPYPPGPKGLPFVGNLLDLPPSHDWVAYSKWSRQFNSDVIHLTLTGSHLLVVNTIEAAIDLFERRAALYNDRPRMPMLKELSNWNWNISLLEYGSKWRLSRRLVHQHFNSTVHHKFEPQIRKATFDLIHRLAQDSSKVMDLIRLMAGSLILSVTYGLEVQSPDDHFLMIVEKTMKIASVAVGPGSFLVDSFPMLKHVPSWFPGAGFKTLADEWRECFYQTAEEPFQYVKEQMAKGNDMPSIVSSCLTKSDGDADAELEDAVRATAATLFAAGSDTTVSSLCTLLLQLVLRPEIVKKAQEELDRVVGPDRLPEMSDRPSLPYINALIKEALRISPVTPLAIPHRLQEDDVYNGFFMPAGSTVLGNTWAILHDERVYEDPEEFNPERFLRDGQLDPDVKAPEDAAFGFGRRNCPGKHFALSTIFLNTACMLHTFDIRKAVGDDGSVITPSGEYVVGSLCHPKPFECSIKPRSAHALNLIQEAYQMHHPE